MRKRRFELRATTDVGKGQRQPFGPEAGLQILKRRGLRRVGPIQCQDPCAGREQRLHPDRPELSQRPGDDADVVLQVEGLHQPAFFQFSAPLRASKVMASSALRAARVVRPMTLSIS